MLLQGTNNTESHHLDLTSVEGWHLIPLESLYFFVEQEISPIKKKLLIDAVNTGRAEVLYTGYVWCLLW